MLEITAIGRDFVNSGPKILNDFFDTVLDARTRSIEDISMTIFENRFLIGHVLILKSYLDKHESERDPVLSALLYTENVYILKMTMLEIGCTLPDRLIDLKRQILEEIGDRNVVVPHSDLDLLDHYQCICLLADTRAGCQYQM